MTMLDSGFVDWNCVGVWKRLMNFSKFSVTGALETSEFSAEIRSLEARLLRWAGSLFRFEPGCGQNAFRLGMKHILPWIWSLFSIWIRYFWSPRDRVFYFGFCWEDVRTRRTLHVYKRCSYMLRTRVDFWSHNEVFVKIRHYLITNTSWVAVKTYAALTFTWLKRF